MLISPILSGTSYCSFLSNQWLRIQNKPLSIKVAVAVVGIFTCCAIAYGCFLGISALRNRVSSQRTQNPVQRFTIDRENSGISVTLPREQCQSAITIPNAEWVQLELKASDNPNSYVLNVLPTLITSEHAVSCFQVSPSGSRSTQTKNVAEAREEINNGEWISIEEFARLTGVP